MKLITAVVRPEKVDDLVLAVADAGARGMTATAVVGFGQQYGHTRAVQTAQHLATLLPKTRVEIVVEDEDAETVISAIVKCVNTGTIGDGKIWVSPVESVIRVRTGERDNSAL